MSDPYENMEPGASDAMMRRRVHEIPTSLPRDEYERRFGAEVDAHLSRVRERFLDANEAAEREQKEAEARRLGALSDAIDAHLDQRRKVTP